jgi:glutamate/tyrosine decarboxylase-like PLP-dependent enzyme
MSVTALPEKGADWLTLKAEMQSMAAGDADWRNLKTAVYVFNAGEEARAVGRDAYTMFMAENGLAPKAFPSLDAMEREVVGFALGLFGAPDGAGCMTGGGSESIFMAMKAARDKARSDGRPGTKVVAPQTAHPSFNKAAHTLGLEVVRTPVGQDYRADPRAMAAAIDEQTIMLIGSAPCFPYGLVDSIEDIDALAAKHGLWLHVDACVGGYFIPFAEAAGVDVGKWNFKLPNVSSISADLHKYGYTPKGASTVLYRSDALYQHQIYTYDVWPCGSMTTPTLAGTRPGGSIAAAWAVLRHFGRSGYTAKARDVLHTREAIEAGAAKLGFETVGDPKLGLVALHHLDRDTLAIADGMRERGWVSARTSSPPAIHLMLQPAHIDAVEDYLLDLTEETVKAPKATGAAGTGFYA